MRVLLTQAGLRVGDDSERAGSRNSSRGAPNVRSGPGFTSTAIRVRPEAKYSSRPSARQDGLTPPLTDIWRWALPGARDSM